MSTREPRPADDDYYEARTDYLRQGDIFTEIPLGQPFPPDAVDYSDGARKFISGPFDVGFGILLTPTCSMAAQGKSGRYAHPHRVIAPVLSLEQLVREGAIKPGAVDGIRRYDNLVNYLYLPSIERARMPESMALLYAPITLHHEYLLGHRVAQLGASAAVHLKRQLALFSGGSLFSHDAFEDDDI